jgi:hypothetical protein
MEARHVDHQKRRDPQLRGLLAPGDPGDDRAEDRNAFASTPSPQRYLIAKARHLARGSSPSGALATARPTRREPAGRSPDAHDPEVEAEKIVPYPRATPGPAQQQQRVLRDVQAGRRCTSPTTARSSPSSCRHREGRVRHSDLGDRTVRCCCRSGVKAGSPHNTSMRAPRRRRPMRRSPGPVPPGIDLDAIVSRVTYVGSGEHKTFPSFAGPPHPRADAGKCDPRLADQGKLTCWLQQAIREGRPEGNGRGISLATSGIGRRVFPTKPVW